MYCEDCDLLVLENQSKTLCLLMEHVPSRGGGRGPKIACTGLQVVLGHCQVTQIEASRASCTGAVPHLADFLLDIHLSVYGSQQVWADEAVQSACEVLVTV